MTYLCSSSAYPSITNMADSSTKKLVADATKLYEANFGSPKGCAVVYAPGRVNIIGEHVDYNGGFCLPVALLKKTVVVGRGALIRKDQADKAVCRVASTNLPEIVEFKANGDLKPGKVKWANYVKGVVAAYLEDVPPGYSLSFDAAIASDVPMGGGLSSSAALEVSMATLLEEITRVNVGGVQKALRCQSSDHKFMGVKCGIMDQFVSSLASEGTALLVDCRSNAYERVPLDDHAVVLVVADSGVKHCNADGSYSERVKQCEMAVQAIKKRHPNMEMLRDASPAWVQEIEGEVDQKVFKRARHVVSEDRRTLCCAMAFRRKDYKFVGGCMNDSHASLRDDYEVSVAELDELVSIAMGVDGVYGSRMTGGGFGGSTVTLVKRDAAELLMNTLREQYFAKTGKTCVCFVTSPCEGAGVIVPLRRPRRLLNYTLLSAAAFVTILVSSVVKLRPGGSSSSATGWLKG